MITLETLLQNTWALLYLLFQICTLWPWAIIKSFLPKNKKDINGEVMFITGAGSGIGRGMSIKFAELGATVICTDINESSAKETASLVKAKGGNAYSYRLDVTDRHKVYELADRIREEIGDVTMLVNNAGIVTGKHFMKCPDELMIKTMEVNTISHFWTLKAFLGPMIKKNHGHVITISSAAGHAGSPALVDYSASKFGAVGLHESITAELLVVADKVKTTNICPFFIKTGMFGGVVSASPYTLPLLEPEDAVNQIVASVLNDELTVFVPGRLRFVIALKNLSPDMLKKPILDYLCLDDQMSNFIGRNQKKD
ncbi:short-chain dehydrogenase/reductase family 16C member 6-like [Hydractinia symbiolongicarpus]|uniref:short-chain dehydrogenase/reductase family 16C member 6-like n=1 Tax=Hydractinia symbiolongicarpus TaxID=13093 RepID=UPI0025503D0D|nr:short-chain dehydrogenase/reductase family 16C member 6-like [Hydractinia symbiolongicarpus]